MIVGQDLDAPGACVVGDTLPSPRPRSRRAPATDAFPRRRPTHLGDAAAVAQSTKVTCESAAGGAANPRGAHVGRPVRRSSAASVRSIPRLHPDRSQMCGRGENRGATALRRRRRRGLDSDPGRRGASLPVYAVHRNVRSSPRRMPSDSAHLRRHAPGVAQHDARPQPGTPNVSTESRSTAESDRARTASIHRTRKVKPPAGSSTGPRLLSADAAVGRCPLRRCSSPSMRLRVPGVWSYAAWSCRSSR